MRQSISVLHLDLDAFFAAVEQRDKPSLRGKPVIVGGVGVRGVVSTASYEARQHGVRSAMSMTEARARCPHAAFLTGRFGAYREASAVVMNELRELSSGVEQLSIDEAFVDLNRLTTAHSQSDSVDLPNFVAQLRANVTQLTGGLTASVGVGSSKLIAKIATELAKPNGSLMVASGSEHRLLAPLPVRALPGVGPATAARLASIGLHTVGDVQAVGADVLIRALGQAAGQSLFTMARAEDHRRIEPVRDAKSISVEDTFTADVTDKNVLGRTVDAMAQVVASRLSKRRLSGRTITLKMRHHTFETHSRSRTLTAPTDSAATISATVRSLLADADLAGGLRLIGVGVSGLTDWVQDELFGAESDAGADLDTPPAVHTHEVQLPARSASEFLPGIDVVHREHGPGWVWGSGLGRVTVRFETRHTDPGPVRTFSIDDPRLSIHRWPESD